MPVITVETELATINCGSCGGTYAIQERYRQEKYQVGGSWHCPYCQGAWGYSGNSENEKLRKELQAAENRLSSERARHDQTKAWLTAQKAQTTKYRNKVERTHKGVCPHCNRHFSNLHAHMTSKHAGMKTPE